MTAVSKNGPVTAAVELRAALRYITDLERERDAWKQIATTLAEAIKNK